MDYFPSTVLAPGKMSLYNLWDLWYKRFHGTKINSNLATSCMICTRNFCNEKNMHNNPSPNPTVLLMWKTLHWGILDMIMVDPFHLHLSLCTLYTALKPLVLATNLNIYMNIYIIYKLYIYMIQSTHNQNTFLTNGHPTW